MTGDGELLSKIETCFGSKLLFEIKVFCIRSAKSPNPKFLQLQWPL